MSTLKMLSDASQEQYIKFFNDIEEMRKENLKPDICSLGNLLYDKENGFCFIDVYPGNQRIRVGDIFRIILNGRFRVLFGFSNVNLLPAEYKEVYLSLIDSIISKILVGLKEYDYPVEEIREFLEQKRYNFSATEIVKIDEIESTIKGIIEKKCKDGIIEIEL